MTEPSGADSGSGQLNQQTLLKTSIQQLVQQPALWLFGRQNNAWLEGGFDLLAATTMQMGLCPEP